MNPERYQQVFEIFMGVCHLPPEEHASALDRACRGDSELRREVEAFLGYYEESAEDVYAEIAAPGARERLAPGTVLANAYRIEEFVGEGGMGAVYRATDLRSGERVAVKVVAGDRAPEIGALRREALAIARLAHPNIVAIHDFGEEPGVGAFLVMELLDGHTLDEEIATRTRLPLDAGLAVVDQIAAAVEAAHAAGVIHRDLKPQNVILAPCGGKTTVKVLDFGLAKLLDPNTVERGLRSISGALVGTPHFMCPEQCEGRPLDARSDVYALGCVLYAAMTGRPPFDGDSLAAVLIKHLDDPPKPPSAYVPDLPPELDAVVLRALSKRPEERHQSMGELRADLARLAIRPDS